MTSQMYVTSVLHFLCLHIKTDSSFFFKSGYGDGLPGPFQPYYDQHAGRVGFDERWKDGYDDKFTTYNYSHESFYPAPQGLHGNPYGDLQNAGRTSDHDVR